MNNVLFNKNVLRINKNVLRKKNAYTLALLAGLSSASSVYASGDDDHDTHREHGAHDHGHATLNIVQEGKNIELMLESPAANIVGFEHAPKNAEEEQLVDNALEALKKGTQLFAFSPSAQCTQTGVEIESELAEHSDHEDEHEESGHDAHEDKHDDEHEESDHNAHEDEHEGHSDFAIHYQFACNNPSSLASLEVQFFKQFPLTEEIDAQIVTDKRQFAAELSAQQPSINF